MKIIDKDSAHVAMYKWYITTKSKNCLIPGLDVSPDVYVCEKWIFKGEEFLVGVIVSDKGLKISITHRVLELKKLFILYYDMDITIAKLRFLINAVAKDILDNYMDNMQSYMKSHKRAMKKAMPKRGVWI